jgi:hypothetical protein
MKITRVKTVILVVLMLACFAGASHASVTDWGWALDAYSNFQDSGSNGCLGVFPDAVNGWDSNDEMIFSGPKVYLGTYHVINGSDGWLGQTGFYPYDFRAPLALTPGTAQTWSIYVWADPTLPTNATFMRFSWLLTRTPPDWLRFNVTLKSKPADISGGPSSGTVWNLSVQPDGGVQLPVFRTSNGLEGYVFDFTVTVVPEPSSLAALTLGAMTLAGALVCGGKGRAGDRR